MTKSEAFTHMGYVPTYFQESIASDNHRYRVVRSGRRSGMSTLLVYEAVAHALANAGAHVLFVTPSHQDGLRIEKFLAEAARHAGALRYHDVSADSLQLHNGSIISVRDCTQTDRLIGYALDFVSVDCASLVEAWVFLEILIPAILAKDGYLLAGDTYPETFWLGDYAASVAPIYPDWVYLHHERV